MKKTISLFALVLMFAGLAQAKGTCPRSQDQLICPGDKVVTADNELAEVLGINPFAGTAAVQNGYYEIRTLPKKSLALHEGCLGMICIGDFVVNKKNIPGKVIGVNPYTRQVAFQDGYFEVRTENIENLSLGLGCVKGICVGDDVISSTNDFGKVIAVNHYSQKVAYQNGYFEIYTVDAETLSSTKYCADYGDKHRSVLSFPLLDKKVYVDLNFQFSLTRPLLK